MDPKLILFWASLSLAAGSVRQQKTVGWQWVGAAIVIAGLMAQVVAARPLTRAPASANGGDWPADTLGYGVDRAARADSGSRIFGLHLQLYAALAIFFQ
jgi:hypothetical protein